MIILLQDSCLGQKLATHNDLLTFDSLDQRTDRETEKASLFRISLTRRSFSNIQGDRSSCAYELRFEIVFLSAWQLIPDLVSEVDILESQLPDLKLFKLEGNDS